MICQDFMTRYLYFSNKDLQVDHLLIHGCSLDTCVEVLRPSQPNGVISSAVSLPNHMFTGQA